MGLLEISILFGGIVSGIILMFILNRLGLNSAKRKSKIIVEEAISNSENIRRQATLDGKQQVYEMKLDAEKEIKEKKNEIQDAQNQLLRREDSLNFRDETIFAKEKQIDERNNQITEKLNNVDKMEKQLQTSIDQQVEVLEKVASYSAVDAKVELMSIVEKQMEQEVALYIRDKEDEAKSKAAEKTRNIIALAIQRYAQEEVVERTVSVVGLPNDDMKGRIIGREGRNIRALENATGVELIIDDTPETITISCFNPLRREIARLSLEALIRDGRIQPGRIEEVVSKISKEMDETIRKTGEDTVFKLGIGKISKELVMVLGRLKYRYSYGQNVLQHSIEVAHFAGIMAAEIGLNQALAKRAGLLHDIGKALDFEQEGTHTELGAKLARKHGEKEIVINAIESHHGEVEPIGLIANIVAAADTLSAARPGARFESMENYVNRLEQLESIANEFDGVDKSFAIQAGREIRVLVIPEVVDDAKMVKIARDIREKIEAELTYPGQIKVTIVRETRVNELAK
ncbi:MAG: ribonuclease Y [Anaerorhabdus sp.]